MNLNTSRQFLIASSVKIKFYEDGNNVTMANLAVSAEFDRQDLGALFGEDLAERVFATLDESPQANLPLDADTEEHDPIWRFGNLTPLYGFEMHNVTIGDEVFGVCPEWGSIKPIKGKSEVEASIVLPIEIASKKQAGLLYEIIGTKQKITFSTQRQLDGIQPPVVKMVRKGEHGNAVPAVV